MAGESSINQDILKKVYVDPVENAVVSTNLVRNNIKFDSKSKTGEEYVGAVMLRRPMGFTFAGEDTMNTAFALNGAIGGNTRKVTVKPSVIMLEDTIGLGFAASVQSEDQAFNPQLGLVISSMVEAHDQMYELNSLQGGQDLGIGNTSTGSTPVGVHQISKASWSPHIWGPIEGCKLDAYSDSTLTTKVTTDGPAILSAVDANTRTVTVTYASASDYTAANAAATGSGLYFTLFGAVGNIAIGMKTILTRSAAGATVFGVDCSQFAYMRASSVAISGALTFEKVANAITMSAGKGGMGDFNVWLNLYSWTDVMNDQAGLRRYVSDQGGEFENGADKLVYHGANGGRLTFECNPMLKAAEAMILDYADWRTIGSTLPTFNLPGTGLEKPLLAYALPGNAGWGIRRFSQTGVYCSRLARQTLLTGIVNDSGPAGGGT